MKYSFGATFEKNGIWYKPVVELEEFDVQKALAEVEIDGERISLFQKFDVIEKLAGFLMAQKMSQEGVITPEQKLEFAQRLSVAIHAASGEVSDD